MVTRPWTVIRMGMAIRFRPLNLKLKNLSSKKVLKPPPAVGEVAEEHPGEVEPATILRRIPNHVLLLQPGLVRDWAENSYEMWCITQKPTYLFVVQFNVQVLLLLAKYLKIFHSHHGPASLPLKVKLNMRCSWWFVSYNNRQNNYSLTKIRYLQVFCHIINSSSPKILFLCFFLKKM